MYSLYWVGNTNQQILKAVEKTAAGLQPFDVMDCGQEKLVQEQVLVRYDKMDKAYDFLPLEKHGAQWTTLVTESHKTAGDVAGYSAGDLWISIFVVKLGFPEGVEIPYEPANHREAPFIKVGWASGTGQEFWVGKTIPSKYIGVIPVASKGGIFSL